jgi:hypothetical protein
MICSSLNRFAFMVRSVGSGLYSCRVLNSGVRSLEATHQRFVLRTEFMALRHVLRSTKYLEWSALSVVLNTPYFVLSA